MKTLDKYVTSKKLEDFRLAQTEKCTLAELYVASRLHALITVQPIECSEPMKEFLKHGWQMANDKTEGI